MRPTYCLALLVAALAATAPAHAQQTADPAMPRAGSWGAEAVVGSGISADLLRFSSPTAAWLAGVTFSVTHQQDEVPAIFGFTDQSGWLGFADARLGRRWWRGDRGERLRPITGLGVTGGVSSGPGIRSWNVGGYGELGASYFFSPHVSLGATSELGVAYMRDRLLNSGGDRTTKRWTFHGTLARVSGAVYF